MKYYVFLTIILFIAMSCTSKSASPEESAEMPAPAAADEAPAGQKQLRHVVLFKFKENTTPEDVAKVEAAFRALPAKIPQIKAFEWGTNNSPEGLSKGFTHCFFLTFDSEADRAVYLPHPDHKAFGAVLTPFLEDVLVVDYWAGE